MGLSMKLEIELLPDEYWWGGLVQDGERMPFDVASRYRRSLYRDLMENQGCPLLVSSRGRYIWSEAPFTFEFNDGRLRIEDALAPVIQSDGHGHLRGAYLAACAKHFPPSGRIPDPLCCPKSRVNFKSKKGA